MPAPQTGAGMTYVHGGRQYLVSAVGSPGFGAALIAYRLPNG